MPGSHQRETISGFVMFLQIDDAQDVIGEAVEMRRDVGVASARPPQAVDAEAGHLEERDLLHLRRAGDVVDAQARAELLAVGDAVGERVLEIAAQVVVGLHRDDVGAVGEQQQVVGDLQVMRAGVVAGGEEADRLQAARIGGVENRHAVAEHVADVDVAAVHHHLHAVGPAALIAVGQVLDALADALRRDFGIRGEGRRCKSRAWPRRRTRRRAVSNADGAKNRSSSLLPKGEAPLIVLFVMRSQTGTIDPT